MPPFNVNRPAYSEIESRYTVLSKPYAVRFSCIVLPFAIARFFNLSFTDIALVIRVPPDTVSLPYHISSVLHISEADSNFCLFV